MLTSTIVVITLLFSSGFSILSALQVFPASVSSNECLFQSVYKENLKVSLPGCPNKCTGIPQRRYFKLHVEPYSTMGPACGECPKNKTACYDPQCITADGIERGILVYNRQLPGPPIEVCVGDKVVVDVINADAHRSTSVHWHGIRQLKTPYSDGVPMVTQCPINPGQIFRYNFIPDAMGTFFYHSHSGIQKIDGLSGPLVVRDVKSRDVMAHHYDHDCSDHIITIQDWIHNAADQKVPGIQKGIFSGSTPKSFLINGRGVYIGATTPEELIKQALAATQPPVTVISLREGRNRIRFISATCLACTVKVTIQGHNMKIIYADGAGPVMPETVDSAILNSGDRFDVVIETTNKQSSYWMLARGQGPCSDAMQVAIIRYPGSTTVPSSNLPLEKPNGVILNPSNPTCNVSNEICVSQLKAPFPAPPFISQVVGEARVLFQFGFKFCSKEELFQSGQFEPYFEPANQILLRAEINSISNKLYPSPLLSQYKDIPNEAFCKRECHEKQLHCRCLNVYKIRKNAVVDLIIADSAKYSKNGLTHPFHLHGFNFYVLKEGIFEKNITESMKDINRWLDQGAMLNKTYAVQKDSIGVPSGGYVILRLLSDNPGFWLFHCHFTLHLDLGMTAVLQVGEVHEMPLPPQNFPKCGNYVPLIKW